MRREEYACPNGCSLPPRKKQLREYSNGIYGFDFYDFTFCPCCGSLMPYSLKKLKGFFEVYNIHAALSDAVQLIYKSEFESAAREAFVAVENYLKKKSGLDLHGFDLATRALSFEIDKQTGEIKRAPLIAINDLKNEKILLWAQSGFWASYIRKQYGKIVQLITVSGEQEYYDLIDAFDIRAFILDTTLSSAPVRPSKYAYVPLADPAAQKTFYLCCQTRNERYIPQLVKK